MSQNRRRGSSGLESYDDYIEAMRDTLRQANRVAEPLSFNLGIDEDMQRFFSMAQLADGSSRWADRSPALRTRWDVQPTEEKKPIITLVSSLPKTTYKESDDSKDRTLSYVKAQRKVLKLLDKHAADELTPVMAATCTQSIDPIDKRPAWEEALRLCYYMRSQGFDTYAKFTGRQHKIMRLFVAERFSTQNRKKDLLYWKQNIETDVVQYIAPRNPQGFDYEPTEHVPPPPLPSEFLNLGREVDGAHEGNEEAAELEARIIEAHERLDHLLLREQQHPLEIEDILDDIAALRRRLHEL